MQKLRFYQNTEDLTPAIIFLDSRGTIEKCPDNPLTTVCYAVKWNGNKAAIWYGRVPIAYLKGRYKRIDSETFHTLDSEIAYAYQEGDISCMREVLACIEYKEA